MLHCLYRIVNTLKETILKVRLKWLLRLGASQRTGGFTVRQLESSFGMIATLRPP